MNAAAAAPKLHRLTVSDYYQMAEVGILPVDARVELIEGVIFDKAHISGPTEHLLTVADYYRMAEVGILAADVRVELIGGEIFDMAPIGSPHASVVDRLGLLLREASGRRAIIRIQSPIRLADHSEPQPDIALLRWRDDFYATAHPGPKDILLIIEVADSSLHHDRTRKLPLYARSGVPEVWLIDLAGKRIERHTQPSGEAYAVQTLITGLVAPMTLPDCGVELGGLV